MKAVRDALAVIEDACRRSEGQLAGNDDRAALVTLAMGMDKVIDVLRPYAKGMPKTVIILRNGNSLQVLTSTNTAADIAGLMNAGTPAVYVGTDVNDGRLHHIRVSEIIDVYEV